MWGDGGPPPDEHKGQDAAGPSAETAINKQALKQEWERSTTPPQNPGPFFKATLPAGAEPKLEGGARLNLGTGDNHRQEMHATPFSHPTSNNNNNNNNNNINNNNNNNYYYDYYYYYPRL